MPVKSTRTAKRQTPLSSQATSGIETRAVESSQPTEPNYSEMSASDFISSIAERNKDPVIGKMLVVPAETVKTDFVEQLEADKRSRSIVISGLPESGGFSSSSEMLDDLEESKTKTTRFCSRLM
ncbi:hypothetical protein RB195_017462 [Necator americanus]|uniref:Uncharacterized protein n=1 Tax=Necator americanus TaxID=51031 RepID=A0ABR1C7I3_NECAM